MGQRIHPDVVEALCRQRLDPDYVPKFPKPRPRVLDRIAYKRELEAKDRAFRLAVWLRDEGKCRQCGRTVTRTLTIGPRQGHVHHRHGRRVRPEDRFNPDMAVLLCAVDHADPKVIAKFRQG